MGKGNKNKKDEDYMKIRKEIKRRQEK